MVRRPGQYIFMQCKGISRYEWHPFTLTSAPGDNFLQVRILSCAWPPLLPSIDARIKAFVMEKASQWPVAPGSNGPA